MATFRKRNGLWQVQVRSRQFGSTSKTFNLKSDAQRWATEQEVLIQTGRFTKHLTPSHSLQNLLERYRDLVTPQKRSHESEIRRINRLINDPISQTQLTQCTPHKAAAFRDRRLNDGIRTAQYDLVILRHAWNVANNEWGWHLGANPFEKIRLPKSNPHRERRLRPGEYEQIKTVAQQRVWYLWPMINLAIETAMRKGELLSLQWSDINLETKRATLTQTKNGKPRIVPLSVQAIRCLTQLPEESDRVFPISEIAIRQAWGRLMKSCEITGMTFHDLRHEAISRFFERGLNVPEVALISGHKTVSQLFRYVQIDLPEDI